MSTYTYENTSRFVETDHGKIHYHKASEGPALLLIHGSGPGVSGWANFGSNLDFFAPHFRCLIIDLPGYGQSLLVQCATYGYCVSDWSFHRFFRFERELKCGSNLTIWELKIVDGISS